MLQKCVIDENDEDVMTKMKLKVLIRRSISLPGWVCCSTQGDVCDHDHNAEDDDDDDLVKVFLDQDGCAVLLKVMFVIMIKMLKMMMMMI